MSRIQSHLETALSKYFEILVRYDSPALRERALPRPRYENLYPSPMQLG